MDIGACWSDAAKGNAPVGSGNPAQIQGLECIIGAALNLIVQLAGIAAFIMLIIGGFKYLTSGGNPEAKKAASGTISYAVLGLALLLGGWLIMLFIKELTGVDVTQFVIPGP